MSLIVPWLVFPLALALLSLGCGLLLERLARIALPGVLVVPAGLAVVIVAADFATASDATAELATPLVVALAIAGLGLSLPWRRGRIDPYGAAAAVGAFAVLAAPVVLSGEATFAGYIKLDDTATWLAITDRVMEHGYSLSGLAPSSYWAVLNDYLTTGYPVGAFVPLGVGHTLVEQDSAWLFQPYVAFVGGMLALALYSLAAPLVRSRPLRALVAFVAAQPALLYAYTLWGGVKEIVGAALLALLAALLGLPLRRPSSVLTVVPLAVVTAAVLGALSLGGVVWLAPLLLAGIGLVFVLHGGGDALRRAGTFTVAALLFAIPPLLTASRFIRQASESSVLTSKNELGNLFHPLSKLQLFGIWPSGDFRLSPSNLNATHVLILALAVGALAGLFLARQLAAWQLLVYAGGLAVACIAVVSFGSPWVDGKALATASPITVLLGMVGAAAVIEGGRRVEGVLLAAAIAGGVLWSNVLAYHDVTLAPRGQLGELARIDREFRGQGPTLLNEFSPYGVRHFLRDMDPESPSVRRVRPIPLRGGEILPHTKNADIDELDLSGMLVYRTLVLRRSPVASRPPSVYQRVWTGRYFEVWQRSDPLLSTIVEHLSLGDRDQPAARPSCEAVEQLAHLAGEGGSLAAVVRPPVQTVELSGVPYNTEVDPHGEDRRVAYLRQRTTLALDLRVPAGTHYDVWLGGTFLARLTLSVDGRKLETRRHQLNWPGQFTPMGQVYLTAGSHRITLDYGGPDLYPGSSGNPQFGAGPVALTRATDRLPVTYVEPAQARSLCARRVDWVEAIRG